MKKFIAVLLALSMLALSTACENPNASKTDKVGSYASGPIYHR